MLIGIVGFGLRRSGLQHWNKTTWQSKAAFEAWTRSEAFRLAHRDAGQNKPLYLDHPQLECFEVRQTVRRAADSAA